MDTPRYQCHQRQVDCCVERARARLEQSEQLQVGDVFDDDRRRDVRDVRMSLSGPIFASLHRRTESVGRRHGPAGRLGRLQLLRMCQQQQHLQHRVLALSIRQGTQAGLEPLQPLPEVSDALDRVTGLDQPVDVLVEPDAVVVRVHHVVGLKPVDHLGTQRGDRLGDETDGQPVEVSALPVALGVELVERAGRDAGGHQAAAPSG